MKKTFIKIIDHLVGIPAAIVYHACCLLGDFIVWIGKKTYAGDDEDLTSDRYEWRQKEQAWRDEVKKEFSK